MRARHGTTAVPILYLHQQREISGGEISLLTLWEHLDRGAFSPILAAPWEGPLADRARRLQLDVYDVRYPRLRTLLGPTLPRMIRHLRALIRERNVHILHGNTPVTNLLAGLAGRLSGCRVIWHERTLPEPHEWDIDRCLRFLPDRLICNSAAVARRFGVRDGRVMVVQNGVPLQRFSPGCGGAKVRRELGLAPEEVAVGIVGNLSPLKRHDLFLHAAALLGPGVSGTRWFVVGGEVFPDNRGREALLRAETRRLGLEGRVRFLGMREDMPAVMDALDVVVSAAQVEACSRAILEAMACGVPVVGADAGGTPELIAAGETGLLFPPGDAQGLAAALRRVIRDAPLRRAMGKAARRRAEEHFGIERQVQAIEAVYTALLETCGTRPGRRSLHGA